MGRKMFTEDWEGTDNLGYIARLAMVEDSASAGLEGFGYGRPGMVVRFADKAASLAMNMGNGRHGAQVEMKCVVSVPRVSLELLRWLPLNSERRWVVYCEDANGLVIQLGTVGDGCGLSVSAAVGGTNGYEMAWSWTGGLKGGDVEMASDLNFNDIIMGVGAIDLRKYKLKDIIVVKGDSFSVDFEFEVAAGMLEDLTGNAFVCVITPNAPSGAAPLATLSVGSGFVLAGGNTKLVLSRTAAQTAAWAVGEYNYTIRRTWPDASVDTIFKGKWVVE